MNNFKETQENIIKIITSINSLYNINPEAALRLSVNVYNKHAEEIQSINHIEIENFLNHFSKSAITPLSTNDCNGCIDCSNSSSSSDGSSSSSDGNSSSSSSCECAPEPPNFTASGGVGGICCSKVCCKSSSSSSGDSSSSSGDSSSSSGDSSSSSGDSSSSSDDDNSSQSSIGPEGLINIIETIFPPSIS